jgi:signal transduction histidine kinase
VDLALVKGEAVVRVTDTGLGLSPEQIEQLFKPFSRPHEDSGSGPKGTGLGLFIAKGIIEQHGGRIWAESPGPGKGSSFCISLPLANGGQATSLPGIAPVGRQRAVGHGLAGISKKPKTVDDVAPHL